jgi:hypothetical protein
MDRLAWLKETRRRAEERFDTRWAPVYDSNWGSTIEPAHRDWFGRFLSRCAPGGLVLDAGCGTGKYWPLLLQSGRQVYGRCSSWLRRGLEIYTSIFW